MDDILSQSQIDDLLSGIGTGRVDFEQNNNKKSFKLYDFNSPKKFTKETFRIINSIQENFVRVFTSYLSSLLRDYPEVSIVSIEEQKYYEYSNALPEHVLITVFDLELGNKSNEVMTTSLDISTTIGFLLIERLLGGSTDDFDLQRTFTEIEMAILKSIIKNIIGHFTDSWQSYIEIQHNILRVETNSKLMQTFNPNDSVIIVVIKVFVNGVQGNVTICMPSLHLDSIFTSVQYTNKVEKVKDIDNNQNKDKIMQNISRTNLKVRAILDEVDVDLQDIVSLKINDIIPLKRGVNDSILIKVGDNKFYEGKIGYKKNKKAVKIENILK